MYRYARVTVVEDKILSFHDAIVAYSKHGLIRISNRPVDMQPVLRLVLQRIRW